MYRANLFLIKFFLHEYEFDIVYKTTIGDIDNIRYHA